MSPIKWLKDLELIHDQLQALPCMCGEMPHYVQQNGKWCLRCSAMSELSEIPNTTPDAIQNRTAYFK